MSPSHQYYTKKFLKVQKKKRRRSKSEIKRRNPALPKPKKTGYNFFFAEEHARLKPYHQGKETDIGRMIVQYQSHPAFVVLIVLIHTLETSTILIIMVEIVILMVGPYIFMLVVVSLIKMIIFFGGIFKLLDKWPQKY